MRPRLLILVAVTLLTLLSLVALAQPRKAGKDKDKEKDKTAEPAADAGAPEEPPKTTPGDDLGDPPPPRDDVDAGPSPSPLNPAANEFPDGGVTAPPVEYDKLLGDIAALRSRAAALTTTLYASKLRVLIQTDDIDEARISGFTLTLDDGVVYSPGTLSAVDEKTIYEHAVAPGHHVIGVEVERYDSRNRQYKTYQHTKMSVVVPESKRVEALIRIEDDSDMAEDFPDDQDGEYDLRVRMRAQVVD